MQKEKHFPFCFFSSYQELVGASPYCPPTRNTAAPLLVRQQMNSSSGSLGDPDRRITTATIDHNDLIGPAPLRVPSPGGSPIHIKIKSTFHGVGDARGFVESRDHHRDRHDSDPSPEPSRLPRRAQPNPTILFAIGSLI